MDITLEKLQMAVPQCKQPVLWVEAFNQHIPSTWDKNQVARFLAQCAHESSSFNITKENLNYSEAGLLKIFPKYFGEGKANPAEYARNPKKIANRVYANRMGNGDEASGDGYSYCGRGLIQLTGKDNYRQFSIATYGDDRILTEPDAVASPDLALQSALWFWKKNKLENISDYVLLTKKINGGTIGIDHRQEMLTKFLSVL